MCLDHFGSKGVVMMPVLSFQRFHPRVLATSQRLTLGSIAQFTPSTLVAPVEPHRRPVFRQANEEATKKGWCDAELSTNKATREEKTDAADALKAEIEDLQSAIVKLGEEVRSGELPFTAVHGMRG